MSGRIPADEKNNYLEKARKLSEAIKIAREKANSIDVEESDIGSKVVEFIFE